jgi:CRP-like cAMP-binding protein
MYEKGHSILKVNDLSKNLIFVEYGVLEAYTEFESNEFVLESLHSGSCINFRSFLMEDTMSVNIRCKENCQVLELPKEIFLKIMVSDEKFKKKILIYQDQLLTKGSKYPLDFIVQTPDI